MGGAASAAVAADPGSETGGTKAAASAARVRLSRARQVLNAAGVDGAAVPQDKLDEMVALCETQLRAEGLDAAEMTDAALAAKFVKRGGGGGGGGGGSGGLCAGFSAGGGGGSSDGGSGGSADPDASALQTVWQLSTQGIALMQQGDPRGAIPFLERARQAGSSLKDAAKRQHLETSTRVMLGQAHLALSEYTAAQEHLTAVLAISQEQGNMGQVLECLGNLGIVSKNLGDHAGAVARAQEAHALAVKFAAAQHNDPKAHDTACRAVCACLCNLGNAYHAGADYAEARKALAQALSLVQQSSGWGDPCREAQIRGNIGNVHADVGNFSRAIDEHTAALALFQSAGAKGVIGAGRCLGDLASVHADLGDYTKAIELHSQALRIAEACGDRRTVGSALTALGGSYRRVGQHVLAVEHYSQAAALAAKLGDRCGYASSLGNLGIACFQLGDTARAVEHFQQALTIATQIGDRKGESHYLTSLANTMGPCKKAWEMYGRTLEIAREMGNRRGEGEALTSLAEAHMRRGELVEAEARFVEAADAFDAVWNALQSDRSRVTFGDDEHVLRALRGLMRVRIAMGQAESALVTAERERGRAFEAVLAGRRWKSVYATADVLPPRPPPQQLAWPELQAAVAKTGSATTRFVVYSQLERNVLIAWVLAGGDGGGRILGFSLLPTSLDVRTLVELVRRRVGAPARSADALGDTALSEGENRGAKKNKVLKKAEKSPEGVLAEEREAQEEAKERDMWACLNDLNVSADEVLGMCYDVLLRPIANEIAEAEHLVILPVGELFALPFAALRDTATSTYLVETCTVRTIPSVGTLVELAKEQPSSHEVKDKEKVDALVVGDPAFSWSFGHGGKLPSLPGALLESAAVEKVLGSVGRSSLVLRSSAASKAAVVQAMPAASVVHLATHGAADRVWLSGEDEDTGTLGMDEVMSLNLARTDLVVLSECDSFCPAENSVLRGGTPVATVKELRADGVVGITRSFMVAGARTLVASLWKVDDAATLELMTGLYERMFLSAVDEVVVDVTAALRGAMVAMIRKGAYTPKQWAAFVVYGLGSLSLG